MVPDHWSSGSQSSRTSDYQDYYSSCASRFVLWTFGRISPTSVYSCLVFDLNNKCNNTVKRFHLNAFRQLFSWVTKDPQEVGAW